MSARATTPGIWLRAEAVIRHRTGSDDAGGGFFCGRFITRSRALSRARPPVAEEAV